eukprot:5353141-Prymnesium_polylepis.2
MSLSLSCAHSEPCSSPITDVAQTLLRRCSDVAHPPIELRLRTLVRRVPDFEYETTQLTSIVQLYGPQHPSYL